MRTKSIEVRIRKDRGAYEKPLIIRTEKTRVIVNGMTAGGCGNTNKVDGRWCC